jgi:curved DNA-binding protein
MDYYKILGVHRGATEDEIKKAYRKLAMTHHPDRGGDEEQFKKIKEAYEKLTSGDINNNTFGSNNFGGFRDLHEMFNMGRRAGGRNWSFDSGWDDELRNPDISISVPCSLEEAHSGFSKEVEFKLPSGELKRMTVSFPPGTHRDIKIRFAGEGGVMVPSRPPGDLYVRANIASHTIWRVDGNDLFAVLEITVWQAMLGTTVEFDDIGGTGMQITVPPGTQSRSQLRLKGKGMNIRGSTMRGNAFLEVVVRIPTLTEEDKTKTIIDLQGKV